MVDINWYFCLQDLQEEYGLKSKATVLSRNVWDILMLLPTNPHIATQFHDFKSDVSGGKYSRAGVPKLGAGGPPCS